MNNIGNLTFSEHIILKRILKHKDDLSFFDLVQNPNITINIIRHLRENGYEDVLTGSVLSICPHITIQFIKEHSFLDWNWFLLLTSTSIPSSAFVSSISIADVLRNKHLPWNKHFYSITRNVCIDNILEHPDIRWNWDSLSTSFHFNTIMDYPELPWNYTMLSMNPTVDLQYVLNHPEIHWLYNKIFKHNNNVKKLIDEVDIWSQISGGDVFWDNISLNTNLTVDLIDKYNMIKWNWSLLPSNINMTGITQEMYENWPWYKKGFSWNPMLHLDHVLMNPSVDWFWNSVLYNIEFDYTNDFDKLISLIPQKYDITNISSNKWFLHVKSGINL